MVKITALIVPKMIKGVRFPNRVSTRSERAPNKGSRKSASTLSKAIMVPVKVSPMPKVFSKIKGMMLSYSCQNAQIEKNARPIKKVRR